MYPPLFGQQHWDPERGGTLSKVTEQVVTGQRPDPGSPKALSSVLSTAPCGLWYHQGYKQDPRNKEDKVSYVRGGQKAIFRSELWWLGGGEAGPWAGPPASLSLSFLLCKEGTTASQGRLKMKGGMAAQLRFLLPIVLWLTERHRKPRNSMSEKEFQCWTGEWVATAQPRDDFQGCKHGNEEVWKTEVKAGSFWV